MVKFSTTYLVKYADGNDELGFGLFPMSDSKISALLKKYKKKGNVVDIIIDTACFEDFQSDLIDLEKDPYHMESYGIVFDFQQSIIEYNNLLQNANLKNLQIAYNVEHIRDCQHYIHILNNSVQLFVVKHNTVAEFAYSILSEIYGDDVIGQLSPYLNLYKFGEEYISTENVINQGGYFVYSK